MSLPPTRSLPSRRSGRRRSLAEVWWTLGTYLHKQVIAWQDRLGLYSYSAWARSVGQAELRKAFEQSKTSQAGGLKVTFILSGEPSSPGAVEWTLLSIQKQKDLDWSLVFFLPNSSRLPQEGWFRALLAENPRLNFVIGVEPLTDWVNSTSYFKGDWMVPLNAGDRLSLAWANLMRAQLQAQPDTDLVYWDEDHLLESGSRVEPFFKPDWSPELLFSLNYLDSAAFRKDLLTGAMQRAMTTSGWIFNATSAARQVVHLPFVLQHRAPEYALRRRERLENHARQVRAELNRRGCAEVVVQLEGDEFLRAQWKGSEPLVSIIIPTKDNLGYLRRCLSTLFEKTGYKNYEVVLMDDHSTDPGVLAYYQSLQAEFANLRICKNEDEFNYSRVNNRGARLAKGELLLFLNNDVEIISPGWLDEMVRWAQMPGVGMVGAKLLYPDGSIQHAGIVAGLTGHAGHLYAGRPAEKPSLFLSPEILRNVTSVTGACMMVRREVFEAIGGFNEDFLLVFNDVEIGLRVQRAGHRVVYNPAAALIHYEGRSRARYIPPEDIWLGADLLSEYIRRGDPYYNGNLSYAVNWPTLRRRTDPQPVNQLQRIARFKG